MADSDGLPPPAVPRVVWWRQLLAIKQTLIIVLTPILLLPVIFISPTTEGKCAYVILIMAVYWCTEALPMAVTALLPVALMPWLDVLGSKQLCQNYLKDANMLFLGGLLVAVAVEKWGLHTRVALRVLMLVGSKPTWILFGFMAVTGFLSMWLSNTACAAMMIPIACAVLKALNEHRKSLQNARRQEILQPLLTTPTDDVTNTETNNGHRKKSIQVIAIERHISVKPSQEEAEMIIEFEREDSEFRKFSCALKLCIAYASNVGGVGTLIGCGPNIVMKGQADSIYGPNNGIDFTSWFVLAFPLMIINIAISWLTLVLLFIGPKKAFGSCCHKKTPEEVEEENGPNSANAIIRHEYAKLGKMTFAEASVMVCFIVLALLWLTKAPGIFPGWLSLLPYHKSPYVTDSSLAITICVLMFALPSQFPNYLCFRRKSDQSRPPGPAPPLLDWPTVHKQMPWSVIILLGGGFALADACQSSGLSAAIGNFLVGFKSLPPTLVVLIMVVVATVITTFTSNVSTTTIVVPITAELANAIQVNPLYLMLPVTIAASYSYILPVSTPPNAIVYSYGDITMMDMIKTGLLNCVLHIGVLMVAVSTWGYAYFHFDIYPDWAPSRLSPNDLFNSTHLPLNMTDLFNSTVSSV